MVFLCRFFKHKWQHIVDITRPETKYDPAVGIYQCRRCKLIITGKLGHVRITGWGEK